MAFTWGWNILAGSGSRNVLEKIIFYKNDFVRESQINRVAWYD